MNVKELRKFWEDMTGDLTYYVPDGINCDYRTWLEEKVLLQENLEAKCKKMEDALHYTINIYENDDSHDCVRIAKQALEG